jgi:1-acyl-sn-glycerol-3-phosphate acyltransferase
MTESIAKIRYPRRRVIRAVLRRLIDGAFFVLSDLKVEGRENLPTSGPRLLVANHFSFIDPVALIRATPWPLEFVGGTVLPNAPPVVRWIPNVWGRYEVVRGGNSRYALRAAEAVLKQGGALGIFPEAGSWATVLRPARPGTAFLAARTGSTLVPVGLDGLTEIFPSLRRGRRARATVRIGKPFGPFEVSGRGRERRRQLDELSHEIMRRISELIPPERRGFYSDDPAIREAAKGTEIYPWEDEPEI